MKKRKHKAGRLTDAYPYGWSAFIPGRFRLLLGQSEIDALSSDLYAKPLAAQETLARWSAYVEGQRRVVHGREFESTLEYATREGDVAHLSAVQFFRSEFNGWLEAQGGVIGSDIVLREMFITAPFTVALIGYRSYVKSPKATLLIRSGLAEFDVPLSQPAVTLGEALEFAERTKGSICALLKGIADRIAECNLAGV